MGDDIAELDNLLASLGPGADPVHVEVRASITIAPSHHQNQDISELDDLLSTLDTPSATVTETYTETAAVRDDDGREITLTKEYSKETEYDLPHAYNRQSESQHHQEHNNTVSELDQLSADLELHSGSRDSYKPSHSNEVQEAVVFRASVAEPQRASMIASPSELDDLISSFSREETSPRPPPRSSFQPSQSAAAAPSVVHKEAKYTPPASSSSSSYKAKSGKDYKPEEYDHIKKNIGNPATVEHGTHHCKHCGNAILGELLTAGGKTYHPDHFVCHSCNSPLGTTPFYDLNGKSTCHKCYEREYLPSCGQCSRPIEGSCLSALGKKWHPEHFVCTRCLNPFQGGRFFEKGGRGYCEKDYFDTFGEKCAACGGAISGESINALGKRYHAQHFVCSHCQVPIGSGNFYDIGGRPYCSQHQSGGDASTCGYCHQPIHGKSVSAANKKWHPEHFVCTQCSTPLIGAYSEAAGKPYCKPCGGRLH